MHISVQKQGLGLQTVGHIVVACCVVILNRYIPSCPCEDLTRAPQMWFCWTETNWLQEPWHRFHIQHHASDKQPRQSPSGEGFIPGSTTPPPLRTKQNFVLLPKSLFSGAHSVASLLYPYYLCGVTPALPISELWLYGAVAPLGWGTLLRNLCLLQWGKDEKGECQIRW